MSIMNSTRRYVLDNQYLEQEYDKMLKEKEETPSLIIPKGFMDFVRSKSFKELLKKCFDYCSFLNELEVKYNRLKE